VQDNEAVASLISSKYQHLVRVSHHITIAAIRRSPARLIKKISLFGVKIQSDLLTIIDTADNGCDRAPLSVPGSCAPGLLSAAQKVYGGLCSAMPSHDGVGIQTYGPTTCSCPLFVLFPPED